ncbi:MAG: hypothetical protein HQK87_06980 [Nitrospinae bacterium]|nr:hypothetical protein [Nitrospinota bacterium]
MERRSWTIGEIRDVMGALLALPGMQKEFGTGMHLLVDTLQAMEEEGWENGDAILEKMMQEWQGQGCFAKKGRKNLREILALRKKMSGENRLVV